MWISTPDHAPRDPPGNGAGGENIRVTLGAHDREDQARGVSRSVMHLDASGPGGRGDGFQRARLEVAREVGEESAAHDHPEPVARAERVPGKDQRRAFGATPFTRSVLTRESRLSARAQMATKTAHEVIKERRRMAPPYAGMFIRRSRAAPCQLTSRTSGGSAARCRRGAGWPPRPRRRNRGSRSFRPSGRPPAQCCTAGAD